MTQGHSLEQISKHLVAAPHDLVCSIGLPHASRPSHLPWRIIAEDLRPIRSQLTHLKLTDMATSEPEIAVLWRMLPQLRHLTLNHCALDDAIILVLLSNWPDLRASIATGCNGITNNGWQALAAGRKVPLRVTVMLPGLSAVVRRRQETQQIVFGKHSITWLEDA